MIKQLLTLAALAFIAGCTAETTEDERKDTETETETPASTEVKVDIEDSKLDERSRSCKRLLTMCMAQPDPRHTFCDAWVVYC